MIRTPLGHLSARRAAGIAAAVGLAIVLAGIGARSASALSGTQTSIQLTTDLNAATAGQTVNLSVTVTGATSSPAGTVLFVENANGTQTQIGSPVTLTSTGATTATATLATSFAAGVYTVTATFRPADPFSFSPSDSNSTLITVSSLAPVPLDTVVTLTATAPVPAVPSVQTLTAAVTQAGGAGTPTGNVIFYGNGVVLGTAGLDSAGVATLPSVSFSAGATYVITASYLGDALDRPAAAPPLTITVAGVSTGVQTTTTASASPSRITAGLSVVINAHVTQVGTATQPPGNSVIFYANGNRLGQSPLDSNGNATLRVDGWLGGDYTITASYIGDSTNLASAGSFTLSVGPTLTGPPPTLTVTAPSVSVTYGGATPTLPPAYAGFTSGDTASSLVSPAVCTTTATSSSPVGSYATTCAGAVDSNYTIAYTGGTLIVTPASLTVTAANATVVAGQPLPALTATVTGFVNGQTNTVISGSAACTTTATATSPAGTYPITCTKGTLSAANYTFGTFTAGALTITPAAATACTTARAIGDIWSHRSSACEVLLYAFNDNDDRGSCSKNNNNGVQAGDTLSVLYSDETPLASGSAAPTATINGKSLAVTVKPVFGRYVAVLSFALPSTLAPGTYTIVLTAHDSDGHSDLVNWPVTVTRSSGSHR